MQMDDLRVEYPEVTGFAVSATRLHPFSKLPESGKCRSWPSRGGRGTFAGPLAAMMLAPKQRRHCTIGPAPNAVKAAVVESIDVIRMRPVSDAVGFLANELPTEPRAVGLE